LIIVVVRLGVGPAQLVSRRNPLNGANVAVECRSNGVPFERCALLAPAATH